MECSDLSNRLQIGRKEPITLRVKLGFAAIENCTVTLSPMGIVRPSPCRSIIASTTSRSAFGWIAAEDALPAHHCRHCRHRAGNLPALKSIGKNNDILAYSQLAEIALINFCFDSSARGVGHAEQRPRGDSAEGVPRSGINSQDRTVEGGNN